MVKTRSNYMVKHTFFGQKSYFCAQILQIFLVSLQSCSKPSPFQWENFMLKTYSTPITNFHAQNLFHSNDKMVNPIPFHQN